MNILLVEDHAESAQMIVAVLEEEGHEVSWAGTGQAALDRLCGEAVAPEAPGPGPYNSQRTPTGPLPDLILLDLTLPDTDAVDLVRHASESVPEMPPIIIVSAKPTDQIESAARDVGASAVIHKPFPLETLLEQIDTVLAHR
jgi:DNA-binding response OmpR family regulator